MSSYEYQRLKTLVNVVPHEINIRSLLKDEYLSLLRSAFNKLIIKKGPYYEFQNPLIESIKTGQIECAKFLIEKRVGASSDICYGEVPLIFACLYDLEPIIELLLNNAAKVTSASIRESFNRRNFRMLRKQSEVSLRKGYKLDIIYLRKLIAVNKDVEFVKIVIPHFQPEDRRDTKIVNNECRKGLLPIVKE